MNSPCSAAPPPGDHDPLRGAVDNTIGQSILEKIGTSPEFTAEVNNHDDHDRPTEDMGDVAIGMTPICDRCGLPRFGPGCEHCSGRGPWLWFAIDGKTGRREGRAEDRVREITGDER